MELGMNICTTLYIQQTTSKSLLCAAQGALLSTRSWSIWEKNLKKSCSSITKPSLFVTQRTAAPQASLFFTISLSLPKVMSIELVMPSNHLILCRPLLLPSVFPSFRVFSNKSVLHIRWSKYWSFSFSISPSNEYWFPLGLTDLISLLSKRLSRVFSSPSTYQMTLHLLWTDLSLPGLSLSPGLSLVCLQTKSAQKGPGTWQVFNRHLSSYPCSPLERTTPSPNEYS